MVRITGNMLNGPWWLKAIAVVGLPGALAIFLTWFVTQEINRDLDAAVDATRGAERALSAHQDFMDMAVRDIVSLLRRICVSVARDERERQGCYEP